MRPHSQQQEGTTDEASTMRSRSLPPFVPVALRWVSFRGLGAGSTPGYERSETSMQYQAESHVEEGRLSAACLATSPPSSSVARDPRPAATSRASPQRPQAALDHGQVPPPAEGRSRRDLAGRSGHQAARILATLWLQEHQPEEPSPTRNQGNQRAPDNKGLKGRLVELIWIEPTAYRASSRGRRLT